MLRRMVNQLNPHSFPPAGKPEGMLHRIEVTYLVAVYVLAKT
jgi:hypothetical protein